VSGRIEKRDREVYGGRYVNEHLRGIEEIEEKGVNEERGTSGRDVKEEWEKAAWKGQRGFRK